MGWIFFSIVAFAVFVVATGAWGVKRYRSVSTGRGVNLAATADTALLDVEAARAVPEVAAALADVRWRAYRRATDGRGVVVGVLLFGPKRITWAPDDRARGWGFAPFQIDWSQVRSATVTPGDSVRAATLTLDLAGGSLTLGAVDGDRAQAALDSRSQGAGAPQPSPAEEPPPA